MKFTKAFPVIVILALVAHLQAVPTVDIVRVSGHYDTATSGGEFTVKDLDANLQSYLNLYAAVAKNQGSTPSFQSFCLELSEATTNNVEYTVDGYAVLGGVGSVAGQDPISDPTAWLYKKFATGTLSGYDYTVGSGREASSRGLQKAIWYLEESVTVPQAPDAEAKAFLDVYIAATGYVGSYENLRSLANAQSGVAVFNPYTIGSDGSITYKQSQLILVPAPGALILGSLGTAFVGWLRRRRA